MELSRSFQNSLFYHNRFLLSKYRSRLQDKLFAEFEASGFVFSVALLVVFSALGTFFYESSSKAGTYIVVSGTLIFSLLVLFRKLLPVGIIALGLFFPLFAEYVDDRDQEPMLYHTMATLLGKVEQITFYARDTGRLEKRIALRLTRDVPGLTANQMVRLNGNADNLQGVEIGDTISFRASLMPLSRAFLPGHFSYRDYFISNGIAAVGRILTPVRMIEKNQNSDSFFSDMRYRLAEHVYSYLQPDVAGIIVALVTGVRDGLTPSTKENMRKSGLSHLFAISGLHVGLVAGLVAGCGMWLWSRSIRLSARADGRLCVGLVAVVIAFLYAMLAGLSLPTQRSFVMLALVLWALFIKRVTLSRHIFALAVLLVILANPNALTEVSFQLSFVATLAIIAFYQDMQHNENFVRQNIRITSWSYPTQIFICSFLATWATMPFLLYHFQYFSVMGIVANFVGVTLVAFFILPLSLLGSLLGIVLQPIGWAESGLSFFWMIVSWGVEILLWTAKVIPEWSDVVSGGSVHPVSFVLMGIGVIITSLLRTSLRLFGVFLWVGGVLSSFLIEKDLPLMVIAPDSRLLGIVDVEKSRIFVSSDKQFFVSKYWRHHMGLGERVQLSGINTIKHQGQFYSVRCEDGVCSIFDQQETLLVRIGVSRDANCTENKDSLCVVPEEVYFKDCEDVQQTPVQIIDMLRLHCLGAHSVWIDEQKKLTIRTDAS